MATLTSPDIAVGQLVQMEVVDGDGVRFIFVIGGASGGGGTGVGSLIFSNVAALEAFDVSTLPNVTGQTAIVTSNGSLWTLDLGAGETLAVDDITIASVTGGPGVARWLRSNANLFLPVYLAQNDWWVDPAAGNDEADGLTPGTALEHHAEVFRRWGNTWEPTLSGDRAVTVHQVTTPINGEDPAYYAPDMNEGGQFVITGVIPITPAFTGTLNVVTAKNPVANQALTASFTTTTGAMAANLLLVNATRGNSRAFALLDNAGVWLLSQPFAPYVGGFPTFTEVDTWAHGDAITGIELTGVDVARTSGHAATFDGSGNVPYLVENCRIIDGDGGFAFVYYDTGLVIYDNVVCERELQATGPSLLCENCTFPGGVLIEGPSSIGGGSIGAAEIGSSITGSFGGEAIFSDVVILGGLNLSNASTSSTYVDTLATVLAATVHAFGSLYGPGELNVLGGNWMSDATGDATVSLPIATKRLAGVDTFYAWTTTLGVTAIQGGVALTSANINANGGFAFGPAGSISMNGLQP